jgi:hypothetical protein
MLLQFDVTLSTSVAWKVLIGRDGKDKKETTGQHSRGRKVGDKSA